MDKIPLEDVINVINNLKAEKWVLDKKSFIQMVDIKGLYDINLCEFLENNKTIDWFEFETPAHHFIKQISPVKSNINRFIPLLKHKETFTDFCEVAEDVIVRSIVDDAYLKLNTEFIETFSQVEKNGICVDVQEFSNHFSNILVNKGMVYSQYNVYTSTGRPSNRYGGVNYAALNTTDGSRRSFISRYGSDGAMVMIDYSAFHPRIICYLLEYSIPPEIDIYAYLAKLYFGKSDINEYDIAESKKITFRQLYGGVDDKYSHIKYLSHLKDYINTQWNMFNDCEYVFTPFFGRKITKKHILNPNPNKLFNYILQASEGEIAIPLLGKVNRYLNNKRTKAVLYTYDSVLYDFHKGDGIETINGIVDIMSDNGKFPTKKYIGKSYQDLDRF